MDHHFTPRTGTPLAPRPGTWLPLAVVCLCATSAAGCASAAARADDGLAGETFVTLYSGKAWTESSDLRVSKPGGTDVTLDRVHWEDESWTAPPYYGLRVGRWFEAAPHWAIALDFGHPKVIADTSRGARASGSENGAPIDVVRPISETVEAFEMTHGHNYVTLNVMRRFQLRVREESLLRLLTPYVGLGAGVGIPHVDATVDGVETSEYKLAGPVYSGFVGSSYSLARHLALVLEYKLTLQDLELDVGRGSTIDAETLTHQAVVGLEFRW